MSADKDYSDWILSTIPVGITVRLQATEDQEYRLADGAVALVEASQALERDVVLAGGGGTVTITGAALPNSCVFVRAEAPITINIGNAGIGRLEGCTFAYLVLYSTETAIVLTNNATDPVNVHVVLLKE